jgi:hypothetical protein
MMSKTHIQGALNALELKAILLLGAIGATLYLLVPDLLRFNVQVNYGLNPDKIEQAVHEYVQMDNYIPSSKFPAFEQIKNNSLAYSFQYTSLGFFTKSLDFLEELERQKAEERIRRLLPPELSLQARNYIKAVLKICEVYQVDPLWVISVMWTESHFRPHAQSEVGASGLMQLMPQTLKYLYQEMRTSGKQLIVENPKFVLNDYFDIAISHKDAPSYVLKLVNIEIGVYYLKNLLKRFNYNHKYATVAYNMGPSWTAKRIHQKLPVGQENTYLNKVMDAYRFMVRRI